MFFLLYLNRAIRDMVQDERRVLLNYYPKNSLLNQPNENFKAFSPFSDWQCTLNDKSLISELNIPGTHDTCALSGGVLVQTQNLTLIQQLQAGIRMIDIRCRHINNTFTIHHGLIYLNLTFGSGVRDVCVNFLKAHPTEFIIMMVKEEYTPQNNTQLFEETMADYISGYENYFYLDEKNPTVEGVRGKIVLLRRFISTIYPMGNFLNVTDDSIYTSNTTIVARVQDYYTIWKSEAKWDKMVELLDEARNQTDHSIWYINYASGTSILDFPYMVAQYVLPLLYDYFRTAYKKVFAGFIMMDFVTDYVPNIIDIIIARNF